MNKFRKAVAFLLALTCIGGTGLTMGVSAEDVSSALTPENAESVLSTSPPVVSSTDFDANEDGVVDMSDQLVALKHTKGIGFVPKYYKLDINQNQIVDQADIDYFGNWFFHKNITSCFVKRVNGKEQEVPYTVPSGVMFLTLDDYADATASRSYRKYSYSTNRGATYTLTPSNMDFSQNTASPNGIVGADSREPSTNLTENTGIVYIKNKDSSFGTGFIVGNHQIATAAHVVYNSGFKSTPTIKTYNESGKLSGKTLTPVEVHIPANYKYKDNPTAEEMQYDYALITVKEDLSQYTHFSLGNCYNTDSSRFIDVPLHVNGCPQKIS